MMIERNRVGIRIISVFTVLAFVWNTVVTGYTQTFSQTMLNLHVPGTMLSVTAEFEPALVCGLSIHPEDPLKFDFIVDPGEGHLKGESLREETLKLIKYFMAALTVPEDQMWVNLSPYEKDRIIPQSLGETEMGRDLLAQDYLLKQLSASLMYPEDELGREFWQRVHKKAFKQFGTTDIRMDTFNKIWIVPEKAEVHVHGTNVFVVESRLKVMMEEDYVALNANAFNAQSRAAFGAEDERRGIALKANDAGAVHLGAERQVSEHLGARREPPLQMGIESEIIREVIIPEIEKEVNEGKIFANLRQIYNSVILATWYKKNLKDSVLAKVYVDRNKIKGIDMDDKSVKERIYRQYLEAFQKGVYDLVKEEYDPATREVIPRKYFAGGIHAQVDAVLADSAVLTAQQLATLNRPGLQRVTFKIDGKADKAMFSSIKTDGTNSVKEDFFERYPNMLVVIYDLVQTLVDNPRGSLHSDQRLVEFEQGRLRAGGIQIINTGDRLEDAREWWIKKLDADVHGQIIVLSQLSMTAHLLRRGSPPQEIFDFKDFLTSAQKGNWVAFNQARVNVFKEAAEIFLGNHVEPSGQIREGQYLYERGFFEDREAVFAVSVEPRHETISVEETQPLNALITQKRAEHQIEFDLVSPYDNRRDAMVKYMERIWQSPEFQKFGFNPSTISIQRTSADNTPIPWHKGTGLMIMKQSGIIERMIGRSVDWEKEAFLYGDGFGDGNDEHMKTAFPQTPFQQVDGGSSGLYEIIQRRIAQMGDRAMSSVGANAAEHIQGDQPKAKHSLKVIQFVPKDGPLFLLIQEIQQRIEDELPEMFVMADEPHVELETVIPAQSTTLNENKLEAQAQRFEERSDVPYGIFEPKTLIANEDFVGIQLDADHESQLEDWQDQLVGGSVSKQKKKYSIAVAWPKQRLDEATAERLQVVLSGYEDRLKKLFMLSEDAVLVYAHHVMPGRSGILSGAAKLKVAAEQKNQATIERFLDQYFYDLLETHFVNGKAVNLSTLKAHIENLLQRARINLEQIYKERTRLKEFLETGDGQLDFTKALYITEVLNQYVLIPNDMIMIFGQKALGRYLLDYGRITKRTIIEIPVSGNKVPGYVVDYKKRSERVSAHAHPTRIVVYEQGIDDMMKNYRDMEEDIRNLKDRTASSSDKDIERILTAMGWEEYSIAMLLSFYHNLYPYFSSPKAMSELRGHIENDLFAHEAFHWHMMFLGGVTVDVLKTIESGDTIMDVVKGYGESISKRLDASIDRMLNTDGSELKRRYERATETKDKGFIEYMAHEVLVNLMLLLHSKMSFHPLIQDFNYEALVDPQRITKSAYTDATDFNLTYFMERLRQQIPDAGKQQAAIFALSHFDEAKAWARDLLAREGRPEILQALNFSIREVAKEADIRFPQVVGDLAMLEKIEELDFFKAEEKKYLLGFIRQRLEFKDVEGRLFKLPTKGNGTAFLDGRDRDKRHLLPDAIDRDKLKNKEVYLRAVNPEDVSVFYKKGEPIIELIFDKKSFGLFQLNGKGDIVPIHQSSHAELTKIVNEKDPEKIKKDYNKLFELRVGQKPRINFPVKKDETTYSYDEIIYMYLDAIVTDYQMYIKALNEDGRENLENQIVQVRIVDPQELQTQGIYHEGQSLIFELYYHGMSFGYLFRSPAGHFSVITGIHRQKMRQVMADYKNGEFNRIEKYNDRIFEIKTAGNGLIIFSDEEININLQQFEEEFGYDLDNQRVRLRIVPMNELRESGLYYSGNPLVFEVRYKGRSLGYVLPNEKETGHFEPMYAAHRTALARVLGELYVEDQALLAQTADKNIIERHKDEIFEIKMPYQSAQIKLGVHNQTIDFYLQELMNEFGLDLRGQRVRFRIVDNTELKQKKIYHGDQGISFEVVHEGSSLGYLLRSPAGHFVPITVIHHEKLGEIIALNQRKEKMEEYHGQILEVVPQENGNIVYRLKDKLGRQRTAYLLLHGLSEKYGYDLINQRVQLRIVDPKELGERGVYHQGQTLIFEVIFRGQSLGFLFESEAGNFLPMAKEHKRVIETFIFKNQDGDEIKEFHNDVFQLSTDGNAQIVFNSDRIQMEKDMVIRLGQIARERGIDLSNRDVWLRVVPPEEIRRKKIYHEGQVLIFEVLYTEESGQPSRKAGQGLGRSRGYLFLNESGHFESMTNIHQPEVGKFIASRDPRKIEKYHNTTFWLTSASEQNKIFLYDQEQQSSFWISLEEIADRLHQNFKNQLFQVRVIPPVKLKKKRIYHEGETLIFEVFHQGKSLGYFLRGKGENFLPMAHFHPFKLGEFIASDNMDDFKQYFGWSFEVWTHDEQQGVDFEGRRYKILLKTFASEYNLDLRNQRVRFRVVHPGELKARRIYYKRRGLILEIIHNKKSLGYLFRKKPGGNLMAIKTVVHHKIINTLLKRKKEISSFYNRILELIVDPSQNKIFLDSGYIDFKELAQELGADFKGKRVQLRVVDPKELKDKNIYYGEQILIFEAFYQGKSMGYMLRNNAGNFEPITRVHREKMRELIFNGSLAAQYYGQVFELVAQPYDRGGFRFVQPKTGKYMIFNLSAFAREFNMNLIKRHLEFRVVNPKELEGKNLYHKGQEWIFEVKAGEKVLGYLLYNTAVANRYYEPIYEVHRDELAKVIETHFADGTRFGGEYFELKTISKGPSVSFYEQKVSKIIYFYQFVNEFGRDLSNSHVQVRPVNLDELEGKKVYHEGQTLVFEAKQEDQSFGYMFRSKDGFVSMHEVHDNILFEMTINGDLNYAWGHEDKVLELKTALAKRLDVQQEGVRMFIGLGRLAIKSGVDLRKKRIQIPMGTIAEDRFLITYNGFPRGFLFRKTGSNSFLYKEPLLDSQRLDINPYEAREIPVVLDRVKEKDGYLQVLINADGTTANYIFEGMADQPVFVTVGEGGKVLSVSHIGHGGKKRFYEQGELEGMQRTTGPGEVDQKKHEAFDRLFPSELIAQWGYLSLDILYEAMLSIDYRLMDSEEHFYVEVIRRAKYLQAHRRKIPRQEKPVKVAEALTQQKQHAESMRNLRMFMSQFTKQQRAVIVLHVDGYQPQEIVNQLNKPSIDLKMVQETIEILNTLSAEESGEDEEGYDEAMVSREKKDWAGSSDHAAVALEQTEKDLGSQEANKGGIDLNPNLIELKTKGERVPFILPNLEGQPMDIMKADIFVPIIINIAPVTDLPLLLGLDIDDLKKLTRVDPPPGKEVSFFYYYQNFFARPVDFEEMARFLGYEIKIA